MDCPTCGRLIGLPDLSDESDLGECLQPDVEFDSDPNRVAGMLRAALQRGSTSHRGRRIRWRMPRSGSRKYILDDATLLKRLRKKMKGDAN